MFFLVPEPKIFLKGSLEIETNMYHSSLGAIVFRGTIVYAATQYNKIPILQLNLRRESDDGSYEYVEVRDNYFPEIPYLKGMENFRKLLIVELRKLTNHEKLLIQEGARNYLDKIRSYADSMSLISQAKAIVGNLQKSQEKEEKAREILKIMGVVPLIDYTFKQVPADAVV